MPSCPNCGNTLPAAALYCNKCGASQTASPGPATPSASPSSAMPPVPEGNVSKRPLHFVWLVDHSGSMRGKKIASLNQAIREALPEVRKALGPHPQVQLLMRAIKFADNAAWHVGPAPVPLEQFVWPELTAAGGTSTAQAIRLLASELATDKMPLRSYPPVCVLVSDGYCTESQGQYESAIQALLGQPWGMKAVRLAIGVGDPSDYDEAELSRFVSHHEIGVLKADSPQHLTAYIRWASVSASVGASLGKSKADGGDSSHVQLGKPEVQITKSTDLF